MIKLFFAGPFRGSRLEIKNAAEMQSRGFDMDVVNCEAQFELQLNEIERTVSQQTRPRQGTSCGLGLSRVTLVCAAVICLHIVLVYAVNSHNPDIIEDFIRKQATVAAPGSQSHHGSLSRSKRSLLSVESDQSSDSQTVDDVNDEQSFVYENEVTDLTHQQDLDGAIDSLHRSGTNAEPSADMKICRTGHVQGLNGAVCDVAVPCLPQLQQQGGVNSKQVIPDSSTPAAAVPSESLNSDVMRKINNMIGRLDSVHFSLVPLLTKMQWSNGVFGAIGEFGVSFGKFTSLLGHNFDSDSGEKLFVSDLFNHTSTSSEKVPTLPGLGRLDIFRAYMKDHGLEHGDGSSLGSNTFYINEGTIQDIDPNLLHQLQIPQFRLISISVDDEQEEEKWNKLISGLKMAACLLRDGGIIIVDGVDELDSTALVRSASAEFLTKHARSAMSPLLMAGNKLFITTNNWRTVYSRYITDNFQQLEDVAIADTSVHKQFLL